MPNFFFFFVVKFQNYLLFENISNLVFLISFWIMIYGELDATAFFEYFQAPLIRFFLFINNEPHCREMNECHRLTIM